MFWCILCVCVFIIGVNTDGTSTTEPTKTTITTKVTTKTTVTTAGSPTLTSTTKSPEVTSTIQNSTISSLPQTLSTVQNHPSVRVIEELKGIAHHVSSGKIMVIDNKIFEIPNFHFDGTAPTAFFRVGKGDTVSENGTVLNLEGSQSPLPAYSGESVKLTLPEGLTVSDIDWLAVWCDKYRQNLGYVFVNKKVFQSPPQTFHFNDNVTSGPIILVNKKTLYIPNFRYSGGYENVHFWAGNGSEPSLNGRMISDETGSLEALHTYQGQNLMISLPDGINTDNIEYFGVWSVDAEVSLGHVPINIVNGVPEASVFKPFSTTISDTLSLRLPKCCADYSVLTTEGCKEKPDPPPFEPTFKVYEHNATHFSNDSLDVTTINFIPFISAPNCESGKYALDEQNDDFGILQNTSLLIKSSAISGILSTDKFCMDNIEFDNNTLEMKILVCIPEIKIQKAMFITYVAFTIISTFCFAITFFLYQFWLKVEDVHRKCFTGYVFAMTMTFLSLTIVQTANVEDGGCEALGFLFQFFMIASFTLLAILCVDIFIIIKYIDETMFFKKRKHWYLGIALGVPVFFMIVSLARNLIPDVPNSFFKPQYMSNRCIFEEENQRTFIFYVPICLSMLVSGGFLIWTKYVILQNDRTKVNNYFWIEKGTVYKFMFRQCFLTLVIMTISWISNVLMSSLDESSGIFNAAIIFEALQGVLIVAVFTMHQYGSNYLDKRRKVSGAVNVEMSPLNPNSRRSEDGNSGGENI